MSESDGCGQCYKMKTEIEKLEEKNKKRINNLERIIELYDEDLDGILKDKELLEARILQLENSEKILIERIKELES